MLPVRGKYPPNWPEIARRVKEKNAHNPDPKSGDFLTVHHLDGNKSNCEEWNLACLCQRCHLYMQHIDIYQGWLFEELHSEWFRPHLEGWRNARAKMARGFCE